MSATDQAPGALQKLARVPAAFATIASRINAIISLVNAISNIQVGGGLRLIKGETQWRIELDGATKDGTNQDVGAGGGLPSGYAEETWTICEDGSPVDVYVLVRRS